MLHFGATGEWISGPRLSMKQPHKSPTLVPRKLAPGQEQAWQASPSHAGWNLALLVPVG